jgi:hypothetical protein
MTVTAPAMPWPLDALMRTTDLGSEARRVGPFFTHSVSALVEHSSSDRMYSTCPPRDCFPPHDIGHIGWDG